MTVATTALMCFYLSSPGHQICSQPMTVNPSDPAGEHAIILMCATKPESDVLRLPECDGSVPPAPAAAAPAGVPVSPVPARPLQTPAAAAPTAPPAAPSKKP